MLVSSFSHMEKGKGIALEGDEAVRPRDIEADSFIALTRGYVARRIASMRRQLEEGPRSFVAEVLPMLEGLDPRF